MDRRAPYPNGADGSSASWLVPELLDIKDQIGALRQGMRADHRETMAVIDLTAERLEQRMDLQHQDHSRWIHRVEKKLDREIAGRSPSRSMPTMSQWIELATIAAVILAGLKAISDPAAAKALLSALASAGGH